MTMTPPSDLARIRSWQAANPERVRAARKRYNVKQRVARHRRGKPVKLSAREARLRQIITANHYTHGCPAGASWWITYGDAIVVFSQPSNPHISRWLIGLPCRVLELSRIWAPDGHRKNLLTEAIAHAVTELRMLEPDVVALIAYADPTAGHEGGVYRAASWTYLGQCDETRAYVTSDGRKLPRRGVVGGKKRRTREALAGEGIAEVRVPGKHRYAKGLTAKARKIISARSGLGRALA